MNAESETSLRVVLRTDFAAQVARFFNHFMSANGHRLVAVVTTPGPKNRRTDSYLGVPIVLDRSSATTKVKSTGPCIA